MDTKNTYKWKIIPELNLVIDVFIGEFSFSEIVNYKEKQKSDVEWRENYNTISDVRLADLNYEVEEIINYNNIGLLDSKLNTKRKTASLTKNPKQVVSQMMLELNKHKDSKVQLKIFSTIEAALYWLEIEAKYIKRVQNEIDQLINEQVPLLCNKS